MRSILYACLMIVSVVLLPIVCPADDASHRKAAEELLLALDVAKNMQVIAQQMLDSLLEQNPQLAPHSAVLKTFMEKHLNWASLKEDMLTIYAQAFTEDELQQLTAFYHTPVGQKAIAKIPELANAGTQLGIMRLQAHQAELLHMIEAEQAKPK